MQASAPALAVTEPLGLKSKAVVWFSVTVVPDTGTGDPKLVKVVGVTGALEIW